MHILHFSPANLSLPFFLFPSCWQHTTVNTENEFPTSKWLLTLFLSQVTTDKWKVLILWDTGFHSFFSWSSHLYHTHSHIDEGDLIVIKIMKDYRGKKSKLLNYKNQVVWPKHRVYGQHKLDSINLMMIIIIISINIEEEEKKILLGG